MRDEEDAKRKREKEDLNRKLIAQEEEERRIQEEEKIRKAIEAQQADKEKIKIKYSEVIFLIYYRFKMIKLYLYLPL